jgi:hypothetical protein
MGELELKIGYDGKIERDAQVAKEEHREPGIRSISFITQGILIRSRETP